MTGPSSAATSQAPNLAAPLQRGVTAQDADPARDARERDAMLRALQAQHAREPVDAAWAAQAEASLASRVSAMPPTGLRAQNMSADCRSRSCLIEASFRSSGDAEDWATFYLTGVGNTLAQARPFVVPRPDGTAEVRIYGVRR